MNWTAFDVDILSEYRTGLDSSGHQCVSTADVTSHHCDILCDATSQIQTQTSSSLGNDQVRSLKVAAEVSWWQQGILSRDPELLSMMILLVFYCPAHSGYLQFTRAPCMPGTGAVIELYGRQYQNITGIMIALVAPGAPLPSPYGDTMIAVIRTETKWSQWQGLGDTNTNNDNSDHETSQTSHPD